ncbi:MAG: hypothetical protein ACK4R0_04845 [Blastomonas sp.]
MPAGMRSCRSLTQCKEGIIMGKGIILWLLGVPGLLVIALLVFGIL